MTLKAITFLLCLGNYHAVFGNESFFFVVDSGHRSEISSDTITKNEIVVDSLPQLHDSLNNLVLDSSLLPLDSLALTDADSFSLSFSKDTLDAPVIYSAEDSIIYDIEGKKVHLYGHAKAKYKNIDLESDYIEYNWANNTLSAEMNKDENGNYIGYAIFKEGESSYRSKKMTYNFKTEKGKIYEVITQEGEGYLHGEAVKRNEYNEWNGLRTRYTTCNLDHPHFYIQAKKSKMIPDKVLATGPANLVIADVPTPLFLPFGLFPISKGKRNGILLPEYGEEANRGFFLRNGGYYFGIGDKMDMEIRGDFYSKGSWAVRTPTRYVKRYKFSGNINLEYGRNRQGEPESPDFTTSNDFRVNWNHAQDSKARPGSTFSANVNFGSTSYDKNFSQDRERIINNSLASKISYSKTWAGKPFNFSTSFFHDQNLNTGVINLTLPVISFGVSRIQPFQSKNPTGKTKWYENIGFSYRFDAQNRISGVDSTFLDAATFKNAKYGIKQSLPISSSFKVLKYFTLSPSIGYNEYWYLQTIKKNWSTDPYYIYNGEIITDTIIGRIVTDTLFGFKSARDFNFNLSLTTKLYGQINFKNKKVKAIRHVFTPSLTFNYTPDFTTPFWGYYKTVQEDTNGKIQTYSIYSQGVYGGPPGGGLQGRVGLNLGNLLEMKVFSKKDTVKNERKIKLLESFNISASYNIAADSLNLSTIGISGRTSLFQNRVGIDFRTTLDPYTVSIENRRINTLVWQSDRRLTRLTDASVSIHSGFQSKPKETPITEEGSEVERLDIQSHLYEYYDFNIPWSFNFSYNIGLSRGVYGNPDTIQISRNSVDLSFDANITAKWKVAIASGYDFRQMDFSNTSLTIIRDLHCWELRFEWMPYPIDYQFYNIQINVKSPVLQDLKLTKKKNRYDNVF